MGMNEGMHEGKQQIEMDILTEATYLQLSKKQHVLDTKIKKKEGITDLSLDRIQLAYAIEVGECVNEMKGDVKYWSNKPANREKFLKEFVDALHFVLSWGNHAYGMNRMAYESYGRISKSFDDKQDYVFVKYDDEPWGYAFVAVALALANIEDSFACLCILAHRYGYTEQEIIDAYFEKNEENERRSDSGVY